MSDPLAVPHDPECLLRIVETAGQVQRRSQFFVWSQGDMQRWLPHQLMVCGVDDWSRRRMVLDAFNSVPLSEEILRAVQDPEGPFIQWAQRAWVQSRRQATLLDVSTLTHPLLQKYLKNDGLMHWIVHGTTKMGRAQDIDSFFMLCMPFRQLDELCVKAMGWLIPYMHATYQRVYEQEKLVVDRGGDASAQSKSACITDREVEMLHWVRQGFSNQQIADQLGISALTVKNHIQKILRKLGATNRAQAVAIALTHKLLSEKQPNA